MFWEIFVDSKFKITKNWKYRKEQLFLVCVIALQFGVCFFILVQDSLFGFSRTTSHPSFVVKTSLRLKWQSWLVRAICFTDKFITVWWKHGHWPKWASSSATYFFLPGLGSLRLRLCQALHLNMHEPALSACCGCTFICNLLSVHRGEPSSLRRNGIKIWIHFPD